MEVESDCWPSAHVLPDYGEGGIHGLARALHDWLHDLAAPCPPAELAAGEQGKILLLVIDGLGANYLADVAGGSELARYCRRRLTSVFPSTTASAITTLMTATSPAQHGLNGWFIHDARFGGVISPLPLEARGKQGPIEGRRVAARLFRQPSMFRGAQRPVVMVSPAEIAFSAYSRHHARGARIRSYQGLPEFEEEIVGAVTSLGPEGGLVHAYYPKFDGLSHMFGCRSDKALSCFELVDQLFARLKDRLAGTGTRILVTADHGFIDSSPERTLELHPDDEVMTMLAAPLFGERRLAFCALRAGAEAEFEAWAAATLPGKGVLMSGADCRASGVLGPGRPNARLQERVGDYVLLMEPGWTVIDEIEGERVFELIGVHGGMTADEMLVPLVLAVC